MKILALLCAFAIPAMASPLNDMDPHMKMTALRPKQPGDQARADAIVAAARRAADRYKDFHKAEVDGYQIFMPEQKQGIYHFVSEAAAAAPFDMDKPPALLYEKAGAGWKLAGIMYMAPFRATEEQLNAEVPLSVGTWHVHTNLCVPPPGAGGDHWLLDDKKFGLSGSITNAPACQQAGGRFMPHLAGWMVHVYPFETDPKKIWAAGMDDDHLMGHHDMMPGMKM